MIDVSAQVGSVRRALGPRTVEGGEAVGLVISQSYAADIDDVWDAITNPERLPRWFAPVTGELREGGHYAVQDNAEGTIERCDPPREFRATWEFGGGKSWIEVRLRAEEAGRTRVELEHIAEPDEHWKLYGPAAVGLGWDLSLMGLGVHLSGAADVDSAEVERWSTSTGGRDFFARCAERWAAADIAAGTDPDGARTRAEKCRRFFSGDSETA